MTFGDNVPALTYTSSGAGLVNNDLLSGDLTSLATSTSKPGSYAITPGTLSAGSNYLINYTNNNLVIEPHLISVTSDDQQNVLCEDIPQVISVVSDLITGKTLVGALAADVLDVTNAKLSISSMILPNTGLILTNDNLLWPNLIANIGIAQPLVSRPLKCERQSVSGLIP
jgi:hypothetical protein